MMVKIDSRTVTIDVPRRTCQGYSSLNARKAILSVKGSGG